MSLLRCVSILALLGFQGNPRLFAQGLKKEASNKNDIWIDARVVSVNRTSHKRYEEHSGRVSQSSKKKEADYRGTSVDVVDHITEIVLETDEQMLTVRPYYTPHIALGLFAAMGGYRGYDYIDLPLRVGDRVPICITGKKEAKLRSTPDKVSRAWIVGQEELREENRALTNEAVVRLTALGLPEQVIIAKIRSARRTLFDVGESDLLALRSGNVPDSVVAAMVERQASADR